MFIITHNKQIYDLESPDYIAVLLADVAHALSNLCRFTGHSREFYSVAEHSVRVFQLLRDRGHTITLQRAGLMHDAHEAYIGDMSTPLKQVLGIRDFEDRHKKAIHKRFQIAQDHSSVVCEADRVLLSTEFRDLLGYSDPALPRPLREKIVPWSREFAKSKFLESCDQMDIL